MNTAEVAVEHVLTGLLALCAFLLPLLSGIEVNESLLTSETLIVVLGLAYLFGVVFDRLADTVLSPIEQWVRLKLADRLYTIKALEYKGDPFPQDDLEFSLRGEQSGRLDWMDSLRSRIRTSRGLAVFGLPAAMGIAILRPGNPMSQLRWDWWPHAAVAVNLILLFTAVCVSSLRFPEDAKSVASAGSAAQMDTQTAPKQSDSGFLETLETKLTNFRKIIAEDSLRKILKSARTDDLLKVNALERKVLLDRSTIRMIICSSFYFLMLINSAITLAVIVVWSKHPWGWAVVMFAVLVVAAFPLLVWRRITETHMSFIYRKLPEFVEAQAARTPNRVSVTEKEP
jgi:hypothetical protein